MIEIRSKFASKNGRVPEFSADPRQGADINSTYQFFHDILKMPKFLATPHLDNSELGDPLLNSYLTVDIQNMDQRLSLSDLISKDIGRLTPLKQKSTDVQKFPIELKSPTSIVQMKTNSILKLCRFVF
ncbi:MAG: hypothetical protein HWD61_14255 [Parachlamydiaceae bacterium]|nr:MAG: hypothetical protein HWD61_14255 [Parachlamydiaceae bacterium]